ncbi:MAG TPA: LemA family protein [Phycisphaerae bacterium]|nr:LemA family protein [Phycisphaerae bacterium]
MMDTASTFSVLAQAEVLVALLPMCACIFVPILIVGLVLMGMYNSLVRGRNHVRESWSGIDTELKRRYDLIPNLVETVKGYARHEREVLERVVEARTRAVASTGSPAQQAQVENFLVGALRQLFALAEGYPQLKASENFLELQRQLTETENRIQAVRRFYNANVRDYNNRCEMFPTSLMASMFSFRQAEFFEIESAVERLSPRVSFGATPPASPDAGA